MQIKYRNNRLEADHGKYKSLINPVRGFQSMKTAYATIKDFEIILRFKKEQFYEWKVEIPFEVMNKLVYTIEI
ncbi:DDE-type integrase/transposase/recombinase [Legionella beliardensis]|uniref:DDE-type integrase/transposase/recombinase n=1 Tax=Legionella beliardensis TaxID=91822 RepID=UPI003BF7FCD1